ncbi:hypothetical protein ACTWP5_06600 [Streptomyces sp. 4N509B]|uniref:hypothetical protein n=1 Tax=Streptomyces sp. 4N509B TaxID=3457413 RepID=UPI003FD5B29D
MADLLLVLVVLTFFGLCVLYAHGIERVIGRDEHAQALAENPSGSRAGPATDAAHVDTPHDAGRGAGGPA